ncbi:MAG TPA: amidase [Burkholderiales bacterium]|jgi:aspartyl-tRNA(Asn)/glutamyl-tRNA(Gln) amidotransferase subunit A|nr:amidase [Burkholderiales bacterium]
MREAWALSALELASAYASRELDPVGVLQTIEERIAMLNPALNAIVARDPDCRAAACESAERLRSGTLRSALEGVPFTVKDNILVAGLPCTWGSRLFEDFMPGEDELPVAKLRAAGAILIGKTNVPEFTLEGYTTNPLFGTTRNPWNIALTPGGSSGGVVAAVAAGLGPFGLGTDGGGSIRRPASHAGLVGLKPSIGRVARGPSLPQILLDFEVIGPVARTVADVALVYRAIAGPEPRDRRSLYGADPRPSHLPLRLLYVSRLGNAPADREVIASADAAARALAANGIRVEQGELPFDVSAITEFWPVLGQVGVAAVLAQHPGRERLVGERMRAMADAGREVPATRYWAGLAAVDDFRRSVSEAFERFDLIMTPSAAALPWPCDEPYPSRIDGEEVGPRGHAVYTGWVNVCGHPAISVPCAPSRSGLPVGIQLVGRFGADEPLLDVAQRFEEANPWSGRWPEMVRNAQREDASA